jgi:hypothetical protein
LQLLLVREDGRSRSTETEVAMARTYRVTCARTTYFDIEIAAESDAEIERLLEAEITAHPERCQRLGRPVHRVVEVAAAQDMAAIPAKDAAAA